ncbi:acyl-CoA dehydrogenase family protein [Thermodesulfobacteriota bacterium]
MDFSLTDEQKAFYDMVLKYSKNELVEDLTEYDHESKWPQHIWERMGAYGLLGLPYPEEYGGQGADCLTTCLAKMAVGASGLDGGITLSWGAHTILCGVPIWKLGTEEQKKRYLPKLASGEWLGGFGLTEPNAGSDATAVQTTAVKKGDRYILNGSKMFITNGPIGKVFIVIASTNKEAKAFGISAFIVESDFPGFSAGKKLDKMGVRTSTTSELIFEDCEVPEENLLDQENFGFINVAKLILGWERSCLLAPAVGAMEAGLERIVQYAKDRVQFKRPIARFQAIQHMLANMKMRLEVSRQLIYRQAWLLDSGAELPMVEAAITKVYLTEAGMKSAEDAVQILGGYGLMKEYIVERGFRDAKLGTIGAGTNEIQRSIIARSLMNLGY